MNKNALSLQYRSQKGLPPEVAADFEKTLARYAEEVKRYDGEKKDIKDKAEGIAKVKLKAQRGGNGGAPGTGQSG